MDQGLLEPAYAIALNAFYLHGSFELKRRGREGGGVKVKFFVSVDIYCYSLQRLVHIYTKQNKQVIIVLVCPDKNNCKIFPRKKKSNVDGLA